MEGMFENAFAFNQPLNDWDVSSVTSMRDMFNGCCNFN
jgi:surface protein